jgi:hypothetical protein
MYKYIILEKGHHTRFESGLDRIADLKILPKIKDGFAS